MKKEKFLEICTFRGAYSAGDAIKEGTLTALELASMLEEYAEEYGDIPVVLSFDSGYTYGAIRDSMLEVENEEEEEY